MYNLTDSHSDLLTTKTKKQQIEFIKNLPSNIKFLNLAIFTTHKKINIKQLKKYKQRINFLQTFTNTHLLFSVEDISSIKECEIDELIKLKPFCVSLTWNYKNQYAGGSLSTSGITKCGKQIIKKLEENNIIIDTAHLNRKSFWQFAKLTTKPILCTHANINSIFSHPRNLTNQEIKKIVGSNGFVGISLYQNFISTHKISAKNIAWQFNYLIKKFKSKNFGFGTDFFGVYKRFLPSNLKRYQDFSTVSAELKKLDYSKETISNIFHKNFENFLNRARKKSS